MQLDKSTWKKIALVVGGAVVLAWLLQNLEFAGTVLSAIWSLLFPFILGYILAFLFNIPMRFIENKVFRGRGGRAKRPLSFVLTIVIILAVITLVGVLVVPQLINTATTLVNNMPAYVEGLQKNVEPIFEYLPVVEEWLAELNIDWKNLLSSLVNILQDGAGNFLSSAVDVATSIVGGVVSTVIGVIFTCYLLLDKDHLIAQSKGLMMAYIPKKRYDKIVEVGRLAGRTYSKFVSGQCIEALLVTVIYFVVLSIGGFQYALLISVLMGFFSIIPMIGIPIGCTLGALILLMSMGFWRALVYLLICFIIQQLEGNLIYPHVVGTSVGLPAVWVLVAVTLGGGLAGVFGMLFFIPLFSVVYALLHRDARRRLAKKGLASPVGDLPPKKRHRRRKWRGDVHPPNGNGNTAVPPQNDDVDGTSNNKTE